MGSFEEHQQLTILHFNDVYHISNNELVSRFATLLTDASHTNPSTSQAVPSLRVFSGDAYSPSLEAAVLRGEHMVPVLNGLDIDVACYGNHDFDFGEARLAELTRQTNFPWTLANAVSGDGSDEGRLLAGAHRYVIKEIPGYRIGFFGLAGTDWPSNCQNLPECTILNPSKVARSVASHLRLVEKCDIVIAITHMRLVEDLAVSNDTLSGIERIDLLLGGHDHHIVCRCYGDDSSDPEDLQTVYDREPRIIKSGTDWRSLSVVHLQLGRANKSGAVISNMSIKQIADVERLPNYKQIPSSPKMLKILHGIHEKIDKVVQQPLLHTKVPLDGRSHIIRSQETNMGNMIADSLRAFYDADVALVNSGSIRCDRIVECMDNSPLCVRDIIEICPFNNAFVVKRVSGFVLAQALENSVSDAHTDGRFLQLSGLRMDVDWRRAEGYRTSSVNHVPQKGTSQPLNSNHMYTVAMVDFIGSGFDGYSCFQTTETLVDAEGAITDTNMLMEIFKAGKQGIDKSERIDRHAEGIVRAKEAIICGYDENDGLPIVEPALGDRIRVIS